MTPPVDAATSARRELDALRGEIEAKGLSFTRVARHQELIAGALARGERPQFSIIDTCRLDNGGILSLEKLASGSTDDSDASGICAFVPAAGAASRYSTPLAPLVQALEKNDDSPLAPHVEALRVQGAAAWPLPPSVKALFSGREPTAEERATILRDLQQPKALMPCVTEGLSFLALKDREHAVLPGLEGQLYVTPPGGRDAFLAMLGVPSVPTGFVDQGPQLSTIRFRRDGRPWVDEQGDVSVVPAGHGALATLFTDAKTLAPRTHSLFIRNIDNVMGTGPAARNATIAFLAGYKHLLATFQSIRQALHAGDVAGAAAFADALLKKTGAKAESPFLSSIVDPAARRLWELLAALVHTTSPEHPTLAELRRLYDRPVNVLGQVPNTAKDVGGTPCWVKTAQGPAKVCIEVPHVSEADKQAYLANPERATHFNPVFVCAEITGDSEYYGRANQNFWLLSEKKHKGDDVAYVETVLYELLGNGELANAVFVEVPRAVFNPHKVLADAAGRAVKDWTPES